MNEVRTKQELLDGLRKAKEEVGDRTLVFIVYFANGECIVSQYVDEWMNTIENSYDDMLRPLDGDESKCITEIISTFDDGTMDFGTAIQSVKDGHRVQRKGWNGKGQYIQLATGISYKASDGSIVNCEHEAIGNQAIAFVGTSGVQMGWLASQADMLAEDWVDLDTE